MPPRGKFRLEYPACPFSTTAMSNIPALMPASACATWTSYEQPPIEVVSIHLGSMPVYSAISFALVVANTASMSWTPMPASRQTFCSASMASIMSVFGVSR